MELHPELTGYIQDHYRLGLLLKHPLVFCIPYDPQLNEMLNLSFEEKKKEVERALAAGNIARAVFMYERPYRVEKLFEWGDSIPDNAEFWRLLGDVYTDCENLHEVHKPFKLLLMNGRPGRENMMNADEQKVLAGFPDEIVVFRGHQGVNKYGYSWTLSHLKAQWFARRFSAVKQEVSWGRVRKRNIIGFFHRRREMDILVDPNDVQAIVKFGLPVVERPPVFQKILDITTKEFALNPVESNHGPDHWAKVEYNGMAICDETPGADLTVVRAFALIHDCKRENEHQDPQHGHRAADFMVFNEELMQLLNLGANRMDKLAHALRYHNDGRVSDDPTIGACWDADRLDLTRVGYVPDPKKFSTKRGRELIFNI